MRKIRKKYAALLLAISMAAGALAGCGGGEKAPETKSAAVQQTAAGQTEGAGAETSKKDTLTVVNTSEPQTLDPVATNAAPSFQCMIQMLETLTQIDTDLSVKMLLAESIDQLDDLTYNVHLRKGVKFHNGEELKASDVIFTFKRAFESSSAVPNLTGLDPEGIKVIDDYTVQFKTTTPMATFGRVLATGSASIVNEKAVTEAGDQAGRSCVGTGPYKFVEWKSGDQIVMEANEDYWGEKAHIPNLIWKFVDDGTARVVMLEAGDADFIYTVPSSAMNGLKENPKVEAVTMTGLGTRWMFMNSRIEPTDNINLRKAMVYAINRPALVKAAFGDYAAVATSFIPPSVLGHTEEIELYEYDPEKAKEYLALAGYPNGLDIKLTMWAQTIQYTMAEIIQANLAEVGINCEIVGMESAAFSEYGRSGQNMFGLASNSNGEGDPNFISKPFSSENYSLLNKAGLNSPEIDDLLVKGRETFDEDERAEIYKKVQQLAAEECCLIPLCHEDVKCAYNAEFKTVELSPLEHYRFANFEW